MGTYAAIDIGTNTVRLLVAEAEASSFRPVYDEQEITRLGEHLLSTRRLSDAPMARTLAVLCRFVERARTLRAEAILAVATSAVREARNGAEFLTRARREVGVEVRVISGEEEAALTILGVLHDLRPAAGILVMDIGGGSTEFALAVRGAPRRLVSTGLGVVKLTERYLASDPPTPQERGALGETVRERIGRVRAELGDLSGVTLVGTAGTVTTLAALDLGLTIYDRAKVTGHIVTRRRVRGLLDWLAGMPLRERLRLAVLEPGRADVIVAGAAIALEALQGLGFDSLVVSDGGLREGILVDFLRRIPPGEILDKAGGVC